MKGIVFFAVSVAIFLFFLTVAIVRKINRKSINGILKPANCIILGVFLATTVLYVPIFIEANSNVVDFKTIAQSIHNSIKLFVVDSDFDNVLLYASALDPVYREIYEIFFSSMFILAPVMTFTFVISLFRDFISGMKLGACFFKNVYVFSELTEKSLALATDVLSGDEKSAIVFADVFFGDEKNELVEKAEEMGAITFKKSMMAINFNVHSKNKKLVFFVIGKDENENIKNSSALIKKYRYLKNAELYLFSNTKQGELLLDSVGEYHTMKIRRVNESSSLVKRYLFDEGSKIFKSAHAVEDNLKVISAIVIGMGSYGTEMAKALPWFCQLNGYRFKLNIFDKDVDTESKFRALCPGYLDPECNRVYIDGEAQYDITVHSGIDYSTYDFEEKLKEIKDASFAFISMGDDAANISCAVNLRTCFERMGIHPKIVAVVHDGDKVRQIKKALSTDKNPRPFDIEYTGMLEELYSMKVIINSELEEKALAVHNKYPSVGKTLRDHEQAFWSNEYNYNSSCASAIHNKVRVECRISGVEKDEKDQTEEEREIITQIEHRRWNAYVRSCGYIYSGSTDKSSRSDIAKLHNCLVPFSELSEEYKKIDTDIGVKK